MPPSASDGPLEDRKLGSRDARPLPSFLLLCIGIHLGVDYWRDGSIDSKMGDQSCAGRGSESRPHFLGDCSPTEVPYWSTLLRRLGGAGYIPISPVLPLEMEGTNAAGEVSLRAVMGRAPRCSNNSTKKCKGNALCLVGMPPFPSRGDISRKELEFDHLVLASPIDEEPLHDLAGMIGNHPDDLISTPGWAPCYR